MPALTQLLFVALALVSIAKQALADSADRTPDRYIELPLDCDIIQLKAMESSGYLGVEDKTNWNADEAVTAVHTYHSAATHFQVKYDTIPSRWMMLSVPSHREPSDFGKKRAYLSFDETGRPQIRDLLSHNLPRNTSFMLSGWPVIRNSTHHVIFAGPYYRLHLVDKDQPSRRIATVGTDRAGRVTLYPAENANRQQGESFAHPPTLFMLSVFRSPGVNSCQHPEPRHRNPRRHTSTALEADSFTVGRQEKRRRRATEIIGGPLAPLPTLVSRLFPAARRLQQ